MCGNRQFSDLGLSVKSLQKNFCVEVKIVCIDFKWNGAQIISAVGSVSGVIFGQRVACDDILKRSEDTIADYLYKAAFRLGGRKKIECMREPRMTSAFVRCHSSMN